MKKRLFLLLAISVCVVISWIGILSGMDNFRIHARAISSGGVDIRLDFLGFKGVVAEFKASLDFSLGSESIEIEPEYLQLTAYGLQGAYYGNQIVNFRTVDPKSFVVTIGGGYGANLKKHVESSETGVELVNFTGILRLKLRTGRFPVEVMYPISAQCEVKE